MSESGLAIMQARVHDDAEADAAERQNANTPKSSPSVALRNPNTLTVPDTSRGFNAGRVSTLSSSPSCAPSDTKVMRLSQVSSMFKRFSVSSRSPDENGQNSGASPAKYESMRSSRHSYTSWFGENLGSSWATDLPQSQRARPNNADVVADQNSSKVKKPWTPLILDDVVSATKYAQDDRLKSESRCLILPGSQFLTIWRVVMVYVVLWAVAMAPFELAFSWWDPPAYLVVLAHLVDLFCVADMCMNFFIPVIKHGRMATERREIALHYLRTWFVLDFLTNIPWDLMLSSAGKSRKVGKILKLPKVFRLTRLLRVAREEAHTLGTFFTVCAILLLAHYFSCLWVWLLIDCPDDDIDNAARCPGIMAAYTEGLSVAMSTLTGSDGWLRFLIESGRTPGFSSKGTGFIWNTPGFGVELAAALNCLVGACSLGVLFANIARAMDKQDSHTRLFNQRLRNVKQAVAQHGLPRDIFLRANKHFHYVWSCGTDSSRALLNDDALSSDLRRELAFSLYGDLLRKVPFLALAESQLLKQLCRHASLEVFSPKDKIVVAGEAGLNLFFLLTGSVIVEDKDGSTLRQLEEGSFFGEIALFFQDFAHRANIVGVTFGWILVVHRDVLLDLCSEELLESFRLVALERNDSIHHDEQAEEVLLNWTPSSSPREGGEGTPFGRRHSAPSIAKVDRGVDSRSLAEFGTRKPVLTRSNTLGNLRRPPAPSSPSDDGGFSSDEEENLNVKAIEKFSGKPAGLEQTDAGKSAASTGKDASMEPLSSDVLHALKQRVLEDNSADGMKLQSKKFTSLDGQNHSPHRQGSRSRTATKQFRSKTSLPWLKVHIKRARALPGNLELYCVCEIPGKALTKQSTNVVIGDPNPEWDEFLEMQNYAKGDDLNFTAFGKDSRRNSDSVLGRASLKSVDFFPEGWQGELELLNVDTGDNDQRSSLHLCIEVFGLGNSSTSAPAPAIPAIVLHGDPTRNTTKEEVLLATSSKDEESVASFLEARLEAKLSHWSHVIDKRLTALEAQGRSREALCLEDLPGSVREFSSPDSEVEEKQAWATASKAAGFSFRSTRCMT